ncbi:hypothetical protein P153DRAFT_260463, partial [Dothidotthia symphoricarpi CBS 119687]
LFAICTLLFFYHLVPRFTPTIDAMVAHMLPSHSTSDAAFCTKDVGGAHCCGLYLAAAPCVDQCRKEHVDRVTLSLTQEYDECADVCMAGYEEGCGK